MKRVLLLWFVLLLVSCGPRGCVESQFTLVPESRLPGWFSIPPGISRSDVTVRLTYYSPSSVQTDNAVLELMTSTGRQLSEVTGRMCWHPTMAKKRNQHGGFDPDSYPHYVYIRVKGIVEVIEHVQGPTFRIIDDPTLVKGAQEAKGCDIG
jgi:hypothetical protein